MSETHFPITRRLRSLALRLEKVPGVGIPVIAFHLWRKYGLRVVTAAKVRNYARAIRDFENHAVRTRSLPTILNLDTYNTCNLACPFCVTGTRQMEREICRMPLEQAMRVIDAVRSHVLEVRLFNLGEPFLNPDIFDLIRYASDAGLFTVIHSNLSLKVDGLPEKVVSSGLDFLSISMDGSTQESLVRYRRKARSDVVKENIRRIIEERNRKGHSRPIVEIACCVFRHNEHELEELKRIGEELGVDGVVPRRAFIYLPSFVPVNPEFQPLHGYGFEGSTCRFLYHELTVEADGRISPCCLSFSRRWDVGTVMDLGNLEGLWNSEQFRRMRSCTGKDPAAVGEEETLCRYCRLFISPDGPPGTLSPLPPHMVYSKNTFHHGLDEHISEPTACIEDERPPVPSGGNECMGE